MRLTITLFFSLLISLVGHAQTGSYYLAQYNLQERGLSNYNYDIVQDNRGLVYMANLQGVLVSDGVDWSLIETPYSVFTLDIDDSNNLYVGGRREIAVIKEAGHSTESYEKIGSITHEVFDIKYHDKAAYFLSENTLYIYNTVSKKLSKIENPSDDGFASLIKIENQLYVGSLKSGIMLIKDEKLAPSKLNLPKNTIGVVSSKKGDLFYFTSVGKYYIKMEGKKNYSPFVIDDDGYLDQNTSLSINWVNTDLLAVSTISGGVVFVNASDGKVAQYMNYENGLLDNEILTVFVGKNNVVWCPTPQGVSIIAPEIPIRNFAAYKGLSGNIQVVYEFNKRFFVGTSVGLFELVKKSVFEEVISYKKITKTEEIVAEPAPQKKKGLFRRKKQRGAPTTTQSNTFYKKQVTKQLTSQNFEFEKIENIESKIVQLVEFNGKLLIGSLSGIYELEGSKGVRIFDEPILYMYKPSSYQFLMASTYSKQVKVIKYLGDKWATTGLLDGLNNYVEQIQEGNNGSLWLCGADSVYRIILSDAYTIDDVEVYPVNNPHLERIYANPYEGKTYFLNTSGYYFYQEHSIKKDTIIEELIGLPKELILSSNNNLWVNTGHVWYGQGENLNKPLNFISLFEDPRYISELGLNKFWVVTGTNQLYKVDGEKFKSISRSFDLFLETAQRDSVALPITNSLGDIDQKSSLSFKFTSPDYTNFFHTEYQYRLKGLSNDWSEWGKQNNEIVFPFLPAGTYELEVRARDALGKIQNSENVRFRILAPYWKRSWFYLIELLFFGGLMALSVFINRKKHKFSLLSRLLTLLTLIFIVEFVQTIAEAKFETNQSPVINFFIQVAIALSILPVESLLRNLITKKEQKDIENAKLALAKETQENKG